MYELFEHTADVGIRVQAETLETLLAEAAAGLFSVIVANLDAVRPVQGMAFRVEASERSDLLHDWLEELLYVFSTRHLVFCQFEVVLTGEGLTASVRGEPVDLARHQLDSEVKAVTYHGLKVEKHPEGWLAEVILDL